MPRENLKDLADEISKMDRAELIRTLRHMPCTFELDFTEEFLNSTSLSRLRHIALAAALHPGPPSPKRRAG